MLTKVRDLPNPTTKGKRARILIVDDDPSVRDLVSILLQRRGMTVDTAEDGERAVARLAEQQYDVILLDLLMPRLDGQGVIEYMRKAGRTDPVIVLSAALDEVPMALDPFIVRVAMRKPLVLDDLGTVIGAVMETARRAAEGTK